MMGKNFGVTPFAALRITSLEMDPYTEVQTDGAPSQIGLSYNSRDIYSVPAFLGAQFDAATSVGYTARLRAFVRIAWMHDFAPYRSINASFISAPGNDFTILGATPPRDSARLDAGINFEIGSHLAFFGNVSSDIAGSDTDYTGSGGLRVSW
jgi:outer membrane autotransporter protein